MPQKRYIHLEPRMRMLRELGWTYERIGEHLEVGVGTVWQRLNPGQLAKHNERRCEQHARRRAAILALYGGKCSECGETIPEVLQLNHIYGGGKEDRRLGSNNSVPLYAAILKGERNDKDYSLLCANCNILHDYKLGRINRPSPERLAAILKINDKCAECGITDMRILQINHLNGGGGKEFVGYGSSGKNFYNAILRGERTTDDLNVLCANHNVLFKPGEVVKATPTLASRINEIRKRLGGNTP